MNIGDKVVCIDDTPCPPCGCKFVVLNQLYVVSDIKVGLDCFGKKTLRICAIGANFRCNCPFDDGYAPDYLFRKLDELKQQAKLKQYETINTPIH